jgi:hypothetical protein
MDYTYATTKAYEALQVQTYYRVCTVKWREGGQGGGIYWVTGSVP